MTGAEWILARTEGRLNLLLERGEVFALGNAATATHTVVPIGRDAQKQFERICATVEPPIEIPPLGHEVSHLSAQPLE